MQSYENFSKKSLSAEKFSATPKFYSSIIKSCSAITWPFFRFGLKNEAGAEEESNKGKGDTKIRRANLTASGNSILKFKCNFSGTVNDVMLRRGWVHNEDEESDDWNIYFCDVYQLHDVDFEKLLDNQRIGHFRNGFEIARKNLLARNLKKLRHKVERAYGRDAGEKFDFCPQSYIIPKDEIVFVQEFRRFPDSFWIIKPAVGAKGRGITIFEKVHDYFKWRKLYENHELPVITPTSSQTTLELPTEIAHNSYSNLDFTYDAEFDDYDCFDDGWSSASSSSSSINDHDHDHAISWRQRVANLENDDFDYCADRDTLSLRELIVTPDNPDSGGSHGGDLANIIDYNYTYVAQRYIPEPLLIGGKKFDLRFYVLVTSYSPLVAWVYREGFARFSAEQFSMSSTEDNNVHLTNVSIQRFADEYDETQGTKWSLQNLREYFTVSYGFRIVDQIMSRLDIVIIRTLQAVQYKVIADKHSFEVYGFDVLIDKELKPWLLEVNSSPAFTPTCEADYTLKCCLIEDTLHILDLENRLTGKEKRVGGFDLIWSKGPIYADSTLLGGYDYSDSEDEFEDEFKADDKSHTKQKEELQIEIGNKSNFVKQVLKKDASKIEDEEIIKFDEEIEPKLNAFLGGNNSDRGEQLRYVFKIAKIAKDAIKERGKNKNPLHSERIVQINYFRKMSSITIPGDNRFSVPK